MALGVASALAVTACSGGDLASMAGRLTGQHAPMPAQPLFNASADAARLAKQAAFGPTQALIDHMRSLPNAAAWIDEQLAASGSSYADLETRTVPTNHCNGLTGSAQNICARDYLSSIPVSMEFYAHAVMAGDQLRQRVAWALSQLMVTSQLEVNSTAGLATFNQLFLDNAFGSYRDLLKAVTLNPYMGSYLNLAGSSKSAPNENYARELMQLFSIGVIQLNPDGTAKTDPTGATLPTYTGDDVHAVARALTGWTYARLNQAPTTPSADLDYSKPMVVNAAAYDTTAKTFLGVTVPAGASQDASVNAVIDAAFNNPSTAPHVCTFLIEQLVTSNPSPRYVARISAVFANDGAGVRGDMKAVIRAILLDPEARGGVAPDGGVGKVKEPVLLSIAIGRLIGDATDGFAFAARDAAMGQQPFRAPSVFNFYPPDYPLPLGGGLISPPTKLLSSATAIARHDLVYDWTINGDASNRGEYAVQSTITGATGTQPSWAYWEAFGTNTGAMLDAINLLMLDGAMTPAQRGALTSAVGPITNADPATQARKRAQTALYIVASSARFQVDR